MAYLLNDPADFADELVDGFVASHRPWVRRVPGGVIRNARPVHGNVAVIIGGGSGHYPAFAGLVGIGVAHGAAMGNVFASPSAQQIYSVARAASSGGGVLFSYGNYAGDVLNFNQAQDRLQSEGIGCQTVIVTDDISSGGRDEAHKRRGIAGGLVVFKAAGAAADAGASLEEVARIASLANQRTRSLGVAFAGCTLPGAHEPLFSVPEGKMAVGVGIHGEPGVGEESIPSADGLAEMLVTRLLEDAPVDDGSARVGVILNGLGAVKGEELFVLYRRVSQLLESVGVEIIDPEVGEMVTSFEMAGVSLTLIRLDEELEGYWRAPANTSAFRKGGFGQGEPVEGTELAEPADTRVVHGTEESQRCARVVTRILDAVKRTVDEHVEEFGRLDSIAGDGDHGIGMQRGAAAAFAAAQLLRADDAGAGTLLVRAGDAWADKAGGTSGALWGIILRRIGATFGDEIWPNAGAVADGIRAATEEVIRFGNARVGDKTLVDVLVPFSSALEDAVAKAEALPVAWHTAAEVADSAAESTSAMEPKIGRARPLAAKSVGTPDPGAVSMAMIIRAVSGELDRTENSNG